MWAKGPAPGGTPKADAMKLLPAGTKCVRIQAAGMVGFSVQLPSGQQVGSGGNAGVAWGNAQSWAERNRSGRT